jgi:hypothetical protein
VAQNVLREMLRTIAYTVKLYLTQNRKAVCEEMPDRAVAAGVECEWATPGRMGSQQSTVILRGADIDRDRVSGINSRCRMARMDLSQRRGDRGPSMTRTG